LGNAKDIKATQEQQTPYAHKKAVRNIDLRKPDYKTFIVNTETQAELVYCYSYTKQKHSVPPCLCVDH
jgi:hypothetical protein